MKKTVEKVKRGRGRPKTNEPTKDTLLNIRLSDIEIEELKILQRDTKADTLTAVIRNFISIGAWVYAEKGWCQPENRIFYQRFNRKWNSTLHHEMYSDSLGLKLKEQKKVEEALSFLKKKDVNK
jgi:hypothetical protein